MSLDIDERELAAQIGNDRNCTPADVGLLHEVANTYASGEHRLAGGQLLKHNNDTDTKDGPACRYCAQGWLLRNRGVSDEEIMGSGRSAFGGDDAEMLEADPSGENLLAWQQSFALAATYLEEEGCSWAMLAHLMRAHDRMADRFGDTVQGAKRLAAVYRAAADTLTERFQAEAAEELKQAMERAALMSGSAAQFAGFMDGETAPPVVEPIQIPAEAQSLKGEA